MDQQLSEVIGTIYDAALQPERWSDTIRFVVEFVGGERGMVGVTNARSGQLEVSEMYRLDQGLMARWRRDYGSEDPWADGLLGVSEGDVGRGSDLISYEELERRPVFRDIVVPVGVYDTCWTAIASNRLRVGFLSVFQGEHLGVFSRDAVARMAVLAPHLVRATRIHSQFIELRERSCALEAAIDELSFALLACTGNAQVVTLNRRAEELFGDQGVLALNAHRLAGHDLTETVRLRELIAQASATSAGESDLGGGVAALSGGGAFVPPMAATVVPISPRVDVSLAPDRPGHATALVVITQPAQELNVPEGALCELFSLTPTEARLALAIAEGKSVDHYAEQAEVSVGTARWTLKKVQAKTGTSKQAALASLIARSLGPLRKAN